MAGEPYNGLVTRRALLGGAEEDVSGTAEDVTEALSSTTIYDAKMVPVDFYADGMRQPIGTGGYVAGVRGTTRGQLTFRQEIRNGDQFLSMLTGAAMTITSGSSYAPTTSFSSRKTWTFRLWEDGRAKQIHGATANVSLEWTNGGRVFANWTWDGVWDAPEDEAMPEQSATAHTTSVYVARSATLTIGAAEIPHTSSGTIDMGNSVVPREDVTAASGISHFFIESRQPQITLDTEARKIAEGAPFATLLSGATAAFVLEMTSGANTLSVTCPAVQRIDVGDEDRGGRRVDQLTLLCCAYSGDDEIVITA